MAVDLLTFWESSYIPYKGDYNKEVNSAYEYTVEIRILQSTTIGDLREMEDFCKEHFGPLDEYSTNSKWQVCNNFEINGFVRGLTKPSLIFLFHNEEHAVTFKLRWA